MIELTKFDHKTIINSCEKSSGITIKNVECSNGQHRTYMTYRSKRQIRPITTWALSGNGNTSLTNTWKRIIRNGGARGHILRSIDPIGCKLRIKKHYIKHRTRLLQQSKQWRAEHPEKLEEYNIRNTIKNKSAEFKKANQIYQQMNPYPRQTIDGHKVYNTSRKLVIKQLMEQFKD